MFNAEKYQLNQEFTDKLSNCTNQCWTKVKATTSGLRGCVFFQCHVAPFMNYNQETGDIQFNLVMISKWQNAAISRGKLSGSELGSEQEVISSHFVPEHVFLLNVNIVSTKWFWIHEIFGLGKQRYPNNTPVFLPAPREIGILGFWTWEEISEKCPSPKWNWDLVVFWMWEEISENYFTASWSVRRCLVSVCLLLCRQKELVT